MQIYDTKIIASLLKDDSIRKSFNELIANQNWSSQLSHINFKNTKLMIEETNDIKMIAKVIVNFLKELNSSKTNKYKYTLRIYNDNCFSFQNPVIMPMKNLNDPMEGLWYYKNISPATLYLIELMKSENLLNACYTTYGYNANEQYMISNYSRKEKRFIEFSKKDFDEKCYELKAFYGFVNYNQRAINRVLQHIKSQLGLSGSYIFPRDKGNVKWAIYSVFEVMFSMFYKWNKMAEEQEYRAIKIKKLESVMEDISIKNNKRKSFKTPVDRNTFYEVKNNVVRELS